MDQQEPSIDPPWNPMAMEFRSVMNFGFADKYLTSALVLGGIEAEGSYHSIHDVPCEFHNGKGRCFKGKHCVKYHPIDGVVPPTSKPAALDKAVHYASMLPPAIKGSPEPGTQFLAKICCINSPIEFYVIPLDRFNCLSGCGLRSISEQPFEPLAGMSGLTELQDALNRFMDAKKRNFQVPEYEEGQLVAVKTQAVLLGMPQSHRLQWFRAIVQERVEFDKTNPYANPPVKVQLVDFGIRVVVRLHETASLPVRFVRDASLTFKCELDGLIPVGGGFSAEAIQHFKSIVMNKEVIVKYMSRREDERDSKNGNSYSDLNRAYSVELSLKDLSAVGIGQLLNQKGYGILAHPFPHRPWILNNCPLSVAGAKLLSVEPTVKIPEDSMLLEEMRRIYVVVGKRDGYFKTPICESIEEDILMKFPLEYGKRGVPVLSQHQIELPQRVTLPKPECVPYNPAGDEDDGDEWSNDGSGTLELFGN